MDDGERLLQLAQRANRRNVTFYTIDARGLVAFDAPIGPAPPPSQRDDDANLRTKQNGLRLIAESTDGVAVVNTNQIDAAVDRIVADVSSYYLLGYYSTNAKLDGRYRSISVTVRRPLVQVRARRGYRALSPNEILAPATAPGGAAASAATAVKPLGGVVIDPHATLLIRTSSWIAPASGDAPSGMFWVVGEIDRALRRDPAWRGGAQADVTIASADGRPVLSKTIEVPASDGTFAIRVPDTGGVAAGEYTVRVRLRPQANAGLPLSDLARVVVPNAPSSIGEPMMWRRGPATGLKYVTTADPRFMRAERLRLEFPVATTTTATAALLDRSGTAIAIPVQVSERTDAGSHMRWIVAEANLSPLAAGDYAIELTADGKRERVEFRVVP